MSEGTGGSAIPVDAHDRVPRAADVQDAGTNPAAEPEPNPLGPGARLATAREAQGLSLGDVARQLKLAVRQVEALERDDYALYPSRVYLRGFLRSYARLLRLDLEHQIAQLGTVEPTSAPATAAPAPRAVGSEARRVRRMRWALAVLLAVLVTIALFRPAPERNTDAERPGIAPAEGIGLNAPPQEAGQAPGQQQSESVMPPAAPPAGPSGSAQ